MAETTGTTTRQRRVSATFKKKVPLTRKATFVGGWDLAPNATETKMLGSVNTVTRTTLNSSTTIKGGPDVYFKPSHMAQYAVASTRLARFLGMEDVISHNAFAHINGQDGVVSGQVTGVPVRTLEHDEETQVPPQYTSADDIAAWLAGQGSKVIQKDGKYFKLTAFVFNPIDYKNPRIQKGMSDLQIFDAISGQTDRHGGNIFVNPQTGKVTGIDDDQAMTTSYYRVDEPQNQYPGLPPLVDRRTAEKILALRPENLEEFLKPRENDQGKLTPKERQAVEGRLRAVQEYLEKLGKAGGLVDTWDDNTYNRQMADPDKTYLGKAETDYHNAISGTSMDGYPTKAGPPLDAPPALPWAEARPTVGVGQRNPSNVPTSPRLPTTLGNRPRPVPRVRKEQPDDQQLVDQFDDLRPLPALPKLPSSPANAAASRMVAEQRRRAAQTEKANEVSPRPMVDDLTASSEPKDTEVSTEGDDPTRVVAPIVSPSRPDEPTDTETRVKVLTALLQDLTGGSLRLDPTDIPTQLKVLNDLIRQMGSPDIH